MNKSDILTTKSIFTVLMLLMATSVSSSAIANHHEKKKAESIANTVHVIDAWARPTFKLAQTGAIYLSIVNQSEKPSSLVSVEVESDVASEAQLHETIMKDNMMSMQQIKKDITISAGESVHFVPSGKHIMLIGLTGPLIEGETLAIDLIFGDGTKLKVSVPIQNTPKNVINTAIM